MSLVVIVLPVTLGVKSMAGPKRIYELDGVMYSMSELSRKSGVCRTTIYNQLKAGKSVAEAVKYKFITPKYYYKGVEYTGKELSELAGISLELFRARVRSGMSVERAVGLKHKVSRRYMLREVKYNLKELSEFWDVCKRTAYRRIADGALDVVVVAWYLGGITGCPTSHQLSIDYVKDIHGDYYWYQWWGRGGVSNYMELTYIGDEPKGLDKLQLVVDTARVKLREHGTEYGNGLLEVE